jgi:hypothetical protein
MREKDDGVKVGEGPEREVAHRQNLIRIYFEGLSRAHVHRMPREAASLDSNLHRTPTAGRE